MWAEMWACGQKRGQIKSRFRATPLYNLQMVHKVKDFMNIPSAFLGDA